MISYEEFEAAALEIASSFPEELFQELNGGIVVRESCRLHPKAEADDLFILGEYHRNKYLGRFIVLYYGSFERCFSFAAQETVLERIRKVLLHEFTHHLESLAGERDLEIQDRIELSRYKYRKQKPLDEVRRED